MTQESSDKHTAANGYALLIGVQSYRAFDASGGHDLKAGWNDVRALWLFCIRAGFRAENIHVLATPGIDHGDIQVLIARESYLAEVRKHAPSDEEREELDNAFDRSSILKAARKESPPTRDAITAALQAMRAHGESHPGAPLLLAYSGHGARTPDGDLALCPEDIDASLAQAIPFATIREELGRFENLTVVLDCCDAPKDADARFQSTTSLSSTAAAPRDDSMVGFRGRIFCAAGRDERAHQAVFDDAAWRSVLTQSLMNNLWRYRMKRDGGLAKDIVTYGDLQKDAERDLQRWGQKPRLLGGHEDVSRLRLFQPDSALHEGPTELTGKVRTGQLVPDFKYRLSYTWNAQEVVLADIFVCKTGDYTRDNTTRFAVDTEVWFVNASALRDATASSTTEISIQREQLPADTNRKINWSKTTLPFAKTCDAAVAWTERGPKAYSSGNSYLFANNTNGNNSYAIQLCIDKSTTPATLVGVSWLSMDTRTTAGIKPGGTGTERLFLAGTLTTWYRATSW